MEAMRTRYNFLIYFLCGLFALLALSACTEHRFSDFIESFMWKSRLVIISSPNETNDETNDDANALRRLLTATTWKMGAPTDVFYIVSNRAVYMNGRLIPSIAASQFTRYFHFSPDNAEMVMIDWDGTELQHVSAKSALPQIRTWLEATPQALTHTQPH